MHVKLFGYFGLQVIGNVDQVNPNSLVVQALQNIANDTQEKQIFYDRIHSDMIHKEIEGSITNNSINKLRLHQREYECDDNWGFVSNYEPTIIYIILK